MIWVTFLLIYTNRCKLFSMVILRTNNYRFIASFIMFVNLFDFKFHNTRKYSYTVCSITNWPDIISGFYLLWKLRQIVPIKFCQKTLHCRNTECWKKLNYFQAYLTNLRKLRWYIFSSNPFSSLTGIIIGNYKKTVSHWFHSRGRFIKNKCFVTV